MPKTLTFATAAVVAASFFSSNAAPRLTQGQLISLDSEGNPAGSCPLRHTDVKAEISGFLARVTVTQEFQNPYRDKIGAVYTFPLPQNAAVDDMTMLVGRRTIRGAVKRREEAKRIYEEARERGHVAGLLDQERPNIFTQHVANIMPGENIKITISYVETLNYEGGSYEFVFPMVVGPRYIPGTPAGRRGGGWAPDTGRVPDASRITPPVTPPGTRAGHDIAVEATLDAGLPIESIECPTHDVVSEQPSVNRAVVRLKDKDIIPNKDFVLRYVVAGRRISDAVLTHRGPRGGFFTLMLQPPERAGAEDITPKELVFVLDTSGSMSGFPIEKAKETMDLAIAGLNPQDTFNLITFSGDTRLLFSEPQPATPENVRRAREFLAGRYGGGGTEMMKAVRAALAPSDSQDHIRVVCFMTDGYVGNDMEIISEVQKHPEARVFSFGIGSSVNRFLLDSMAKYGRGEVEYVGLNDDGSAAARRFHERVRSPLLTDISIDWGGLPVSELYPARIPDLFSAKPVIISGRYANAAAGTIRLRGKMAGREFVRDIHVKLPDKEEQHDVLASLWARRKVDDLMSRDFAGLQSGDVAAAVREGITKLGLEFRLMTQFTSFVAVEEKIITEGGQPRRVEVPVEMPEGVSYEGVFGETKVAMKSGLVQSAAAGGFAAGPRRSMDAVILRPREHREKAPAPPPVQTPTGKRKAALNKLAPPLLRAFESGSGRMVAVQVMLSDAPASALAKLKAVGFEMIREPKTGKIVTGRIAASKLAELAELAFVKYVSPL